MAEQKLSQPMRAILENLRQRGSFTYDPRQSFRMDRTIKALVRRGLVNVNHVYASENWRVTLVAQQDTPTGRAALEESAGVYADFISSADRIRATENQREARINAAKPQQFRKRPVTITAYQTLSPLNIPTLEGVMHADAGDWIITGVKGEQYPCKPDIFALTYEPMTPAGRAALTAPVFETPDGTSKPISSAPDEPESYPATIPVISDSLASLLIKDEAHLNAFGREQLAAWRAKNAEPTRDDLIAALGDVLRIAVNCCEEVQMKKSDLNALATAQMLLSRCQ